MRTVTIVDIFGAGSQIGMLVIFLCVMFIPAFIRIRYDRKQGISKISHKEY
jgi:hypothetical protein